MRQFIDRKNLHVHAQIPVGLVYCWLCHELQWAYVLLVGCLILECHYQWRNNTPSMILITVIVGRLLTALCYVHCCHRVLSTTDRWLSDFWACRPTRSACRTTLTTVDGGRCYTACSIDRHLPSLMWSTNLDRRRALLTTLNNTVDVTAGLQLQTERLYARLPAITHWLVAVA